MVPAVGAPNNRLPLSRRERTISSLAAGRGAIFGSALPDASCRPKTQEGWCGGIWKSVKLVARK